MAAPLIDHPAIDDDAAWCAWFRRLDAEHGTTLPSILHHDRRCPVHLPIVTTEERSLKMLIERRGRRVIIHHGNGERTVIRYPNWLRAVRAARYLRRA